MLLCFFCLIYFDLNWRLPGSSLNKLHHQQRDLRGGNRVESRSRIRKKQKPRISSPSEVTTFVSGCQKLMPCPGTHKRTRDPVRYIVSLDISRIRNEEMKLKLEALVFSLPIFAPSPHHLCELNGSLVERNEINIRKLQSNLCENRIQSRQAAFSGPVQGEYDAMQDPCDQNSRRVTRSRMMF